VAVPNTGSRWVGAKKCYMKGCEWGENPHCDGNRERRGKEETLLEDLKGSICECMYTSSTSQDFSLILSYDEFALRASSSRNY